MDLKLIDPIRRSNQLRGVGAKDGSRRHLNAAASTRSFRPEEDLAGTPASKVHRAAALHKAEALQNALLHSANFAIIATDEKGIIQLFNVGAERMLGYAAVDVLNRRSPSDVHEPQEVIARAKALSGEFATVVVPGFE